LKLNVEKVIYLIGFIMVTVLIIQRKKMKKKNQRLNSYGEERKWNSILG